MTRQYYMTSWGNFLTFGCYTNTTYNNELSPFLKKKFITLVTFNKLFCLQQVQSRGLIDIQIFSKNQSKTFTIDSAKYPTQWGFVEKKNQRPSLIRPTRWGFLTKNNYRPGSINRHSRVLLFCIPLCQTSLAKKSIHFKVILEFAKAYIHLLYCQCKKQSAKTICFRLTLFPFDHF